MISMTAAVALANATMEMYTKNPQAAYEMFQCDPTANDDVSFDQFCAAMERRIAARLNDVSR